MKFAVALAGIFLSISTVVSAGIVTSRSVLDNCGGGQVTGNSSVDHNGNSIGFVSATCPQSGSTKRSDIEERQYSLCTGGDCTITCETTTNYEIVPADCVTVIEYLAEYASSTVDIPPRSYHEWYSGSCGIYFLNLDPSYYYTVCYAEVAYDATAAGDACVGITNGAVCTGSQQPGAEYQIVIESP